MEKMIEEGRKEQTLAQMIPGVWNRLNDSQKKWARKIYDTAIEMGVTDWDDLQALLTIAYLESSFRPYVVGPQLEKGIFQLSQIAIEDLQNNGLYHDEGLVNLRNGIEFYKLLKRRGVRMAGDIPTAVEMATAWLCGRGINDMDYCYLSEVCRERADRAFQVIHQDPPFCDGV